MNIKNLLYLSYWFSQPYILYGWAKWVWVGGFLLLVLGGLIIKILRQTKIDHLVREVMRRYSSLGLTMGILGLIWLFFRQQRVAFLAWRFWLWFWIIGFIWWAVKVTIYTVRRLPHIRAEKIERETKDKYLPKRKR